MAAPVNSTNSVSAGLQMASLAAAQAQQSSAKPVANASAASASTTTAANAAQTPQSTTAATVVAATVAATTAKASSGADSGASKTVAQAAEQLQAYFQPQQTVTLNVDKTSGESFVKIVDSQTKQLILQIPSAEVLAMAQKLQEQGNPQGKPAGTLVDQEG